MAKRNYGVNDIQKWNFDEPNIPAEWAAHLGELPVPFRIYVDGDGGHGKTEYQMLFSKMTSQYIGKTHLNNVEQGKHKSIQQSHARNNFQNEVKPGKWMYNDINDFDEYVDFLRRPGSCRVAIIDSISYWPLNAKNIQYLFEEFPRKSFVLVAYEADAGKNKPIKHLCDIKVNVKDFVAYTNGTSRFGGNEPYIISPEMHRKKLLGKKAMKKGYVQQPGLF